MEPIFQQIILGIVQGIVEWLPFSSEGVLLLVRTYFFEEIAVETFIRQALFLHLGTFFAALIYFRKDVKEIIHGTFNYKKTDVVTKRTIKFLVIATLISGVLGLALIQFFNLIDTKLILSNKIITFSVGILLLVTGFIQLKVGRGGTRNAYHLNTKDGIFLGIAQGFAVLPGLSRSGLTVSSLLFRNIEETNALRLSFILSLPIVLIGNILLNLHDVQFVSGMFFGILFAFISGLLTIHIFMRISQRVKFGHFVLIMAFLMIAASFI